MKQKALEALDASRKYLSFASHASAHGCPVSAHQYRALARYYISVAYRLAYIVDAS